MNYIKLPPYFPSHVYTQTDEAEPDYDERCQCGHSPSQHRTIPRQYKRAESIPCDCCNCLDYEETLK